MTGTLTPLWVRELGDDDEPFLATAAAGIVITYRPSLHQYVATDLETGDDIWQVPSRDDAFNVTIGDAGVYIDGYLTLTRVDPATGAVTTVDTDGWLAGIAADGRVLSGSVTRDPVTLLAVGTTPALPDNGIALPDGTHYATYDCTTDPDGPPAVTLHTLGETATTSGTASGCSGFFFQSATAFTDGSIRVEGGGGDVIFNATSGTTYDNPSGYTFVAGTGCGATMLYVACSNGVAANDNDIDSVAAETTGTDPAPGASPPAPQAPDTTANDGPAAYIDVLTGERLGLYPPDCGDDVSIQPVFGTDLTVCGAGDELVVHNFRTGDVVYRQPGIDVGGYEDMDLAVVDGDVLFVSTGDAIAAYRIT